MDKIRITTKIINSIPVSMPEIVGCEGAIRGGMDAKDRLEKRARNGNLLVGRTS